MKKIDRRQFLKFSAVALGGIILTGCGSGNGGHNLANGYRFYRIKNAGDAVGSSSRSMMIDNFYGSAHISSNGSSNGIISFDAINSNKRRGLFQLGIDFDTNNPKIEWERSALLVGDQLADERVVSTCKSCDIDENGNIAAVIEADLRHSEEHYGAGLYVDVDQQGFEPILIAGQEFNGDELKSSGIFEDISFVDNSILASVHHLPGPGSTSKQKNSLLHIPAFTLESSQIVMSAGDIILGTEHKVTSFGLIDHNANGDYSAGVFTSQPLLDATLNGSSHTLNISGNVAYPNDMQVATASPEAGLDDLFITGGAGYGTRIGPNGEVYTVLDVDDQMVIVQDSKVVLSSGQVTNNGTLLGFSTGSVGTDGVYYYTAITEHNGNFGMTLFAFNGQRHSALISSGDVLSDGGAPVDQILFGTTTKHVDSNNRLVFFCSFADGTTSLVLGVPC